MTREDGSPPPFPSPSCSCSYSYSCSGPSDVRQARGSSRDRSGARHLVHPMSSETNWRNGGVPFWSVLVQQGGSKSTKESSRPQPQSLLGCRARVREKRRPAAGPGETRRIVAGWRRVNRGTGWTEGQVIWRTLWVLFRRTDPARLQFRGFRLPPTQRQTTIWMSRTRQLNCCRATPGGRGTGRQGDRSSGAPFGSFSVGPTPPGSPAWVPSVPVRSAHLHSGDPGRTRPPFAPPSYVPAPPSRTRYTGTARHVTPRKRRATARDSNSPFEGSPCPGCSKVCPQSPFPSG
jgi:hypothetical protein